MYVFSLVQQRRNLAIGTNEERKETKQENIANDKVNKSYLNVLWKKVGALWCFKVVCNVTHIKQNAITHCVSEYVPTFSHFYLIVLIHEIGYSKFSVQWHQ